MKILLLSLYELGHQPLGLARPAAELLAAGHEVRCVDLAVDSLDEQAVRDCDFVGISVPMHTAARLGMRVVGRVRRLNAAAHVCFFGLYAALNADLLVAGPADSVIGGEVEAPLVELAGRLTRGEGGVPEGVQTRSGGGEPSFTRRIPSLPERSLLPPLARYARFHNGTSERLAGYVEASRGCAHRCLHCPITPVYGGRLRIVPADVVLRDVHQLVAMGAEHITFGDPDFFNGVRHSTNIVEQLHRDFPHVTYDATIKVEHLIEHRQLLPLLRETGCAFVVSAVEAVDDGVLRHLQKGHTASDVLLALGLARAAGLVVRPTFVAFTPWTTADSYLRGLSFVQEEGLIGHIDPVQYAIRLLVPRGSSLLGTDSLAPHLGLFDPELLVYRWSHPDPRMDELQRALASLVEDAAHGDAEPGEVFSRIRRLAHERLGGSRPAALPGRVASVPRLTEAWFC